MNVYTIQVWPLLAGLGLFLFGMYMLEESLKNLAGRSFKKFLRRHTVNPMKAVLSGALLTSILQSSSMVTLLVMSFAGAGIIGLSNGIGVILGANLGTTVTGWLVTMLGFKLNIEEIILPFLAIGGLGIIFLKSERLSNLSKLLMGFSFMFLGLGYMKDGFAEVSQQIDFEFLAGKSSLLFVLIGLVLTALIQSSSAAMMIFLSSLAAGVIVLDKAIYLVIGAHLGTTVTAIIGTFKGNSIRKKVGWSQFYFNLFNSVVAFTFAGYYLKIIDLIGIADPLVDLVIFHSMLNAIGIILVLPFLKNFTGFINRIVTSKEVSQAKIIGLADAGESHAAMDALEKEALNFLYRTLDANSAFFHLQRKSLNTAEIYFGLKRYEAEVVDFYVRLQQSPLNEEEVSKINSIVAAIRNATLSAKDIKDIKHNLDQFGSTENDKIFAWYKDMCENQKKFYDKIRDILRNIKVAEENELDEIKIFQHSLYHHEMEEAYKLFSSIRQSDVDISSALNMARQINSSNESLLRAVKNAIKK